MDLLRKKDLIERTGLPKSTASDWLREFHMYIPTVSQGSTVYYRPETIDVLVSVKELRDRGMAKTQIAEELAKKFPINVNEPKTLAAQEDGRKTDGRTDILSVMSAMGKVVEQLGRQDELIRAQDEKIRSLQDQVTAAREREAEMVQFIQELREQVAATREREELLDSVVTDTAKQSNNRIQQIEEQVREREAKFERQLQAIQAEQDKSFWAKLFGRK